MFHWSMIIWGRAISSLCDPKEKIQLSWLYKSADFEVAAVQYEDKHWKCYRNFGHCQLDQDAAQHQANRLETTKKAWCHEGDGKIVCFLVDGFMIHHFSLWLDLPHQVHTAMMCFSSVCWLFMVTVDDRQVGHCMCQQPLESAESTFGSVQLPVLLASFECWWIDTFFEQICWGTDVRWCLVLWILSNVVVYIRFI